MDLSKMSIQEKEQLLANLKCDIGKEYEEKNKKRYTENNDKFQGRFFYLKKETNHGFIDQYIKVLACDPTNIFQFFCLAVEIPNPEAFAHTKNVGYKYMYINYSPVHIAHIGLMCNDMDTKKKVYHSYTEITKEEFVAALERNNKTIKDYFL